MLSVFYAHFLRLDIREYSMFDGTTDTIHRALSMVPLVIIPNNVWLIANYDKRLKTKLDLNWPAHTSLQICRTSESGRFGYFSLITDNTRNQRDSAAILEWSLASEVIVMFSFTSTPSIAKGTITKLKKSVGRTIDKSRLNNSLAINGTLLRFAYRKIDT